MPIIARQLYGLLLIILLLQGCSSQSFNIKHVAKADIDMVSDSVVSNVRSDLIELTRKLYKRNPSQLHRVNNMTLQKRLSLLFDETGPLQFEELLDLQGVAAMQLAFQPSYKGDRVFALMAGLVDMIRSSYNYKHDFYILDELQAQRLYNSARNIEVMAWQLKNKKDKRGEPLIITHGQQGVVDNLSFERIYGKLIALQDIMATVVADRDNRNINTVIKGTLSVFLPI